MRIANRFNKKHILVGTRLPESEQSVSKLKNEHMSEKTQDLSQGLNCGLRLTSCRETAGAANDTWSAKDRNFTSRMQEEKCQMRVEVDAFREQIF